MVLEQAMMVVEADEADMAPDIDQFLSAYETALDDAIAGCDAAPAPEGAAPEGEAPPAEGEAPPAEGEAPPAEGEAPPADGGE